jgi:hypothetical protein
VPDVILKEEEKKVVENKANQDIGANNNKEPI